MARITRQSGAARAHPRSYLHGSRLLTGCFLAVAVTSEPYRSPCCLGYVLGGEPKKLCAISGRLKSPPRVIPKRETRVLQQNIYRKCRWRRNPEGESVI